MAAYGAELISVPAGKMELARDLAHELQVLPSSIQAQISDGSKIEIFFDHCQLHKRRETCGSGADALPVLTQVSLQVNISPMGT